MLSESKVRTLIEPFGLNLTTRQVDQILAYLDLLLRWNQKINLTALQTEEECLTRHFGESLYLSRWFEIEGELLDIGSGAGFPGLALKIVFPQIAITLLEPRAKKRAFLKEAARICGMESVEVRSQRLEGFLPQIRGQAFDAVTARAVGKPDQLVPLAVQCLKKGGHLFLWLSHEQTKGLSKPDAPILWLPFIPLPLSRQRGIWAGKCVR